MEYIRHGPHFERQYLSHKVTRRNILQSHKKHVEWMLNVHLEFYNLFAIVHGAACLWDEDSLRNIMIACITMHNMIVEDERDEEVDFIYDQMGENVTVSHADAPEHDAFIANYQKIKDNETHTQLQADLVEHLWNIYPDLYNISSNE
jgi:hypothetical protein